MGTDGGKQTQQTPASAERALGFPGRIKAVDHTAGLTFVVTHREVGLALGLRRQAEDEAVPSYGVVWVAGTHRLYPLEPDTHTHNVFRMSSRQGRSPVLPL